jgi:HPt (histidine-containing phosphotransfer) domain-containing protein
MPQTEKIIIHPDEEVLHLLPRFLENLRKELAAVVQAVERQDWDRVRGIGHILKGSGSSFGCDEVTRLGALLEEAGRACRTDLALSLEQELTDYVSRVEVAPR